MSEHLVDTARIIADRLRELEDNKKAIGAKAFFALEGLDHELVTIASSIWGDPVSASEWFTEQVESLGWRTPWQCLAEGERDEVVRILHCIQYGLPA